MTKVKIFAGLLSCTLLSAPVLAEDLAGTLKKIKDTGTIKIGHLENSIPFAYLDDKFQPVGYAIDLCMKVVDAVKVQLQMPNLKVVLQPISAPNRVPLLISGTIDLECGATTNTQQRQQQVAFGPTYFVANVTAAVKKSSGINSIADLNGKTISTASGTTSVPLLKTYGKSKSIEVKEIYGKGAVESFQMMVDGRAAAFVMDDILLAGQIANVGNPQEFKILPESLRQEPYSMMLRKDDPQFKVLVHKTVGELMKSGEIVKIYNKWFMQPIPPKKINLNFQMTPAIRDAFKNPNDQGV